MIIHPLRGDTCNNFKVYQVNAPTFPLRCVMVQLNQNITYSTIQAITQITRSKKYDWWPSFNGTTYTEYNMIYIHIYGYILSLAQGSMKMHPHFSLLSPQVLSSMLGPRSIPYLCHCNTTSFVLSAMYSLKQIHCNDVLQYEWQVGVPFFLVFKHTLLNVSSRL